MKHETHEKILTTALQLFAQKGYYGVTTREIAKEVGINELTLFRHFGSKLNLFEELMDFFATDAKSDDLLTGIEALPFEQSMPIIIQRICQLFEKNLTLYKIQMKLTDAADVIKLKLSRELIKLLEAYFLDLTILKQVEGDAHLMAVTLINSLLGMYTVDILSKSTVSQASIEMLIQEHTKQFITTYQIK